MFLAKKDGCVYCHKSLSGLAQFGITKADLEIPDAEFEAAGNTAQLVNGKIVIGKTAEETQAEQAAQRQTRIDAIERQLRDIDAKSSRAARSISPAFANGETPDANDLSHLASLEADARKLHTELVRL